MIAALLQTPSHFHIVERFQNETIRCELGKFRPLLDKEEEEKKTKISSLIEHDFVHLGPEKALPKIISR